MKFVTRMYDCSNKKVDKKSEKKVSGKSKKESNKKRIQLITVPILDRVNEYANVESTQIEQNESVQFVCSTIEEKVAFVDEQM